MQIKEGKFYRRRDGKIVGPAEKSSKVEFPFRAGGHTYRANGFYYNGGDYLDLVEEVPAPSLKAPDCSTDDGPAETPGTPDDEEDDNFVFITIEEGIMTEIDMNIVDEVRIVKRDGAIHIIKIKS
jgi:hypothetical protein